MKTRDELIIDAKGFFEQYPDEQVFHATGDGMFFANKQRGDGVNHARAIGADLHTIQKSDTEAQLTETEPTDKWKVADIKEWMAKASIGFDEKDTKAILLTKIADTKKTPEPEAEPTAEWEVTKIQSWMTLKEIAFTEADNTVEALIALIEASKTPKE
jgi:hypothetical protein